MSPQASPQASPREDKEELEDAPEPEPQPELTSYKAEIDELKAKLAQRDAELKELKDKHQLELLEAKGTAALEVASMVVSSTAITDSDVRDAISQIFTPAVLDGKESLL